MSEITSPAKSAVQYGLFFGVIIILEFVIPYVMGLDLIKNQALGLIINLLNYLVLPILFISLAINNFKKNINNGFLSFGQGLKAGVSVTTIAGLLSAVFMIIFFLIFPEYGQEILEKTREVMVEKNPNMTQEQLDMSISMMEKFTKPYIVAPFTVAMYAFLGLIYSLIISAILKNDKPQGY
ncbi:magnesium-transporting ATPase (P-type) [Flavobacterium gossypii]|jgi:hypothetical protein|uniref:Uncharacterized protein DUF4199 n=2 Tax=Flavobacterium TaxID=237 RepID=A0A495M8C8_9FLAO|nr:MULTISPECIES: DUF4199 domain-containing protein [Flavobacterium]MBA9074500.1 magnesium-transporting ATPase (P-type) [Flavobacterium gossypii]RKS21698.1 uncharacterized protein DUF4199 [Flavobacterium endophyticum]WDO14605.1 DUF4199 domain-containing protein [Flavobacterium sp. WW92]